jgi:hypothetical protein
MRLGVVLAVNGALAAGASAAVPFSPQTLAGTWEGRWENERLLTEGPAAIVAKPLANDRLRVTIEFGGRLFGCRSLPPDSRALARGNGANRWNGRGFVLAGKSKPLGQMTLTYSAGSGKLVGRGANPPCAHGVRWAVAGAFSGQYFTGSMKTTIAGQPGSTIALTLIRRAS